MKILLIGNPCHRLCLQIPLEKYGQRVMEGAMQEVVEKKNQLLGHRE